MPQPSILSLQSQVVYGHVGNSAAVLALQRLGFEVWPVPTVLLAHHPGHGRPKGRTLPPDEVRNLIAGLSDLGALAHCTALLSGYLGDPGTGAVLLDAVSGLRAANPAAIFACDPVIGDADRGVYVRPGIGEFFRDQAVPAANILLPNQFELEYLTGRKIVTLADALAAADALRARGPNLVLCTSLHHAEAEPGSIATLAVAASGAWLVRTPHIDQVPNGSGDLLSALFLGQRLLGRPVPNALARAVAATYGVLKASAGAAEMCLVAAQEQLAAPSERLAAERVR